MNDHPRVINNMLLFILTSFWPPWLYALGVFLLFLLDKSPDHVTLSIGGQNEEDKSDP